MSNLAHGYYHCLSEIEMKRNMIFFSTGTSYLTLVVRVYQQKNANNYLANKLKNVKLLVLCVGHKVLFSTALGIVIKADAAGIGIQTCGISVIPLRLHYFFKIQINIF
jgi:hypothetical protein